MSDPSKNAGKSSTARIEQEIAQTRDSLSQTLVALEAKLNPPDLREKIGAELEKVEQRAKALIGEQLIEAKALLREEVTELEGKARQGLADAAVAIKSGLHEMKESVKEDLRGAFIEAKQSLRDATVGRVEDLATTLGDKMNDTKESLIETVRANPIPATLIGAGLVWLLMNRSKSAARRTRTSRSFRPSGEEVEGVFEEAAGAVESTGQQASQVAHQAVDAAASAVHSATGAVGSAVHGIAGAAGRVATQAGAAAKSIAEGAGKTASQIKEQAGQLYGRAAEGARKGVERAGQGYTHTLQENPLVLAGAALAIGAIVGFALPRTRREDTLMGPSRDRLLRRAGKSAQDAAASVANLAEEAIQGSSKETARA